VLGVGDFLEGERGRRKGRRNVGMGKWRWELQVCRCVELAQCKNLIWGKRVQRCFSRRCLVLDVQSLRVFDATGL
jgi:hypothetical protein